MTHIAGSQDEEQHRLRLSGQSCVLAMIVIHMFKQMFSSTACDCDSQSAKEEHTLLKTHQRFSHDETDLALGCCGEVGEQALEDILPGFAFRVNADGHHGWGTLLSLRTADWRDGGFGVSVPYGRGYRGMQKKKKKREEKQDGKQLCSVKH